MNRLRSRTRAPDVHVITTMGEPEPGVSPVASHRARMQRYVLSMGLRTVCFVAAILTQGWLRWSLVIAAVVVPYFAVLLANSDTRTRGITSQARW